MKGGGIMKLIKQLAKSIREFKKPAIWTVLLIANEIVIRWKSLHLENETIKDKE